MAWYPTLQSLQRTAAAAGALALLLATAPVVPRLDADGDPTLSSGTAHAQGKGGGRGRGQGGHANIGKGHDDRPSVRFGHTSEKPGRGLGHEKARGYGHRHDGDSVGHHNSDSSFSGAMDNAGRDFGRSSAKKAWSDLLN